jgi:hypothetical protein
VDYVVCGQGDGAHRGARDPTQLHWEAYKQELVTLGRGNFFEIEILNDEDSSFDDEHSVRWESPQIRIKVLRVVERHVVCAA